MQRARRFHWAAMAVTAAVLLAPATASAGVQVPRGYTFCGWKDTVNGGWTYEKQEEGAFVRLFARRMSCRIARRKFRKVRYERTPPYRPTLKRFRCGRIVREYEYEDARCVRRGHPRIAVRWQAGA